MLFQFGECFHNQLRYRNCSFRMLGARKRSPDSGGSAPLIGTMITSGMSSVENSLLPKSTERPPAIFPLKQEALSKSTR